MSHSTPRDYLSLVVRSIREYLPYVSRSISTRVLGLQNLHLCTMLYDL